MKSLFKLLPTFISAQVIAFPFNSSPWIDHPLNPLLEVDVAYECFDRIGECKYLGRSLFIEGKLPFAISSDLDFFIGALLSDTHAHNIAFDSFSQGVRTVLLDDARGDCFAFTAGLELREVLKVGLVDPSIFHHGHFEALFSLSAGREWSYSDDWLYRVYGFSAIGIAERGSPWILATLGVKNCMEKCHCLFLELDLNKGLGSNKIHLHEFDGYGGVNYTAIDLALGYSFEIDCADLTFTLYHRLFSKNAPSDLTGVALNIQYPFSL